MRFRILVFGKVCRRNTWRSPGLTNAGGDGTLVDINCAAIPEADTILLARKHEQAKQPH